MGTIYNNKTATGMVYYNIKKQPGILLRILGTQIYCLFRAFAASNIKQRIAGYRGVTVGLLGIR